MTRTASQLVSKPVSQTAFKTISKTATRPLAFLVFASGFLLPLPHASAQSVTGTDPVPHSSVSTPTAPPAPPAGQTSSASVMDIVLSWLGLS